MRVCSMYSLTAIQFLLVIICPSERHIQRRSTLFVPICRDFLSNTASVEDTHLLYFFWVSLSFFITRIYWIIVLTNYISIPLLHGSVTLILGLSLIHQQNIMLNYFYYILHMRFLVTIIMNPCTTKILFLPVIEFCWYVQVRSKHVLNFSTVFNGPSECISVLVLDMRRRWE